MACTWLESAPFFFQPLGMTKWRQCRLCIVLTSIRRLTKRTNPELFFYFYFPPSFQLRHSSNIKKEVRTPLSSSPFSQLLISKPISINGQSTLPPTRGPGFLLRLIMKSITKITHSLVRNPLTRNVHTLQCWSLLYIQSYLQSTDCSNDIVHDNCARNAPAL